MKPTEKSVEWSEAADDGRNWETRINEFARYLMGEVPEGVKTRKLRLSRTAAMSVIWFLQEVTGALPNNFEMCCVCGEMYDDASEGCHKDNTGKFYCENHIPDGTW